MQDLKLSNLALSQCSLHRQCGIVNHWTAREVPTYLKKTFPQLFTLFDARHSFIKI